jgi:cytochrome c biogenesis protein CcmG/thiol:disulfide interchange protein DsbE
MRTLRRQSPGILPDLLEPEAPPPRRWRWLWGLVAAGVLVVAAVGVSRATGDRLSKVPGTIRLTGPAKTFTLDDVRPGRPPVSLEALRGRPVVLNFFGSWCPPCVRELPALEAISQRYKGRVAFIGVTFNDGKDQARALLEHTGVTYPAAFDPKSDLAYDYGIAGMPTTVFIDPAGNRLAQKTGEFTDVQLEKAVNEVFGRFLPAGER